MVGGGGLKPPERRRLTFSRKRGGLIVKEEAREGLEAKKRKQLRFSRGVYSHTRWKKT